LLPPELISLDYLIGLAKAPPGRVLLEEA